MSYKCLSLCDFFVVQQFFKLCHIAVLKLVGGDGAHLGKYQNFSANFVQPAEINKPY